MAIQHYHFTQSPFKPLIEHIDKGIIRVVYGDIKEATALSDAVQITGMRDVHTCLKPLVIEDVTVGLNEAGLIRIQNASGQVIHEDLGLRYNCKGVSEDYQEQTYEVINRDIHKVYAYELKKRIEPEAGYYGMGEKYGPINFNGRNTEHFNTDVLGVAPIHTAAQLAYHTSIPYYMMLKGALTHGVFLDATYKTYFDFGKYDSNLIIRADGGIPDYYVVLGPDVKEVMSGYTQLTGRCPLPRRDFLGYQQCRWSYMSSEAVLEIAHGFRNRGIPLDVIYLDIDYMQDYKVFTWDSERFRDFKAMLKALKAMNVKLVVIIDPGVKKESGYHAYDSGMEADVFIKDANGKVYLGRVWPGESAFPDFLSTHVRRWWQTLHQELLADGVSGIWNDMNEIADMSTETKTVPEDTYHILDSGTKVLQKEAHNVYGHYQAKASYEAMVGLKPDVRPFVLTRAASVGTQRYSALWTGDNTSIWEHLEMSIPMLLNLGLSGYAFVGSDIGGFVGDTEPELLERWMQLGAFYPLCRNHSCINSLMQEPWAFGPTTEAIVTKAIRYRYSLISEFYQLFVEHQNTGLPIMRPLFLYDQDDVRTHNIQDSFMIGDQILVAPIVKPKTYERLVYLPKGTWYHEATDTWYAGKESHIMKADSKTIPVFIRGGSILLRNLPVTSVDKDLEGTLELHVYKGPDNTRQLYFDDGQSFAYTSNHYSVVHVHVEGEKVDIQVIKDDYKIPTFKVHYHG